MTWREHYAPIITAVLKAHPEDTPERRKALRDAYPAGERAHWPYKVWLDEVALQTGKKTRTRSRNGKQPVEGQGSLI